MRKDIYEIKEGKVVRKNPFCPKCGPGFFLASHKNRLSCGHCGYTKWTESKEKQMKKDLLEGAKERQKHEAAEKKRLEEEEKKIEARKAAEEAEKAKPEEEKKEDKKEALPEQKPAEQDKKENK